MLTQEEYMDIVALRRQGWTIGQIADSTGKHPATISSWLKKGGPPPRRQPPAGHVAVVDDRWSARVGQLLEANPELLATSIERIIAAEGYEGSYESLVRHLRVVRGVRRRRSAGVSVPIETAPGAEFQFDWSDCGDWGETWGLGPLQCFGAVLCWSRRRHWWFAPSLDRAHTFEGLVRFFEDVGGVAALGRTDRMGALGTTRGGVFRFCPEAVEFARYHGFAFKACAARDAKRKGKCERPFGELNSAFMQEMALEPPASVGELNTRVARWLEVYVNPREHRVTGEAPAVRLAAEQPLLGPLPRVRFDTARREPRVVNAPLPLVEVDRVAYSVPPRLVGATVEVRLPVDAGIVEIRHAGEIVATHRLGVAGQGPVWDPAHRAAAEALALAPHRRHLSVVSPSPGPAGPVDLDLGDGDYDVAAVDLRRYDTGCGCTGAGA
ncbi:MAG: IS21 family transposase [Actinomycetota bacterium]|jgi:transposase|nr:IS21 family transposase [Actinomycetota bacterium]